MFAYCASWVSFRSFDEYDDEYDDTFDESGFAVNDGLAPDGAYPCDV